MSVGLCVLLTPPCFSELHHSSWTPHVPTPSTVSCSPLHPLTPSRGSQVFPSALDEWNWKFFHLRSEPRGQVGNVCFTLCNESHLLLSATMVIDSVLTPWFVFRQLLPSLHLAVAISLLLSVISSLVALPPSWAAAAPRRRLCINSTVRSSSPAQMGDYSWAKDDRRKKGRSYSQASSC